MRARLSAGPARWLLGAAMLASALAGLGPASGADAEVAAVPCLTMAGMQPPNPGSADLQGVAVLSPCDAWAVGSYSPRLEPPTLIEHWDGATWTQVRSADLPDNAGAELTSVAAVSATNIWAVGSYNAVGAGSRTLVEHWDGTAWTRVPSPSPSESSSLLAVMATSATNAVAVGTFGNEGDFGEPLIERWDGTQWTQQSARPSLPQPATSSWAWVGRPAMSGRWARPRRGR